MIAMDTLTLLTITETCPPGHAILVTARSGVGCTVHKDCALHFVRDQTDWDSAPVNAEHVAMLKGQECMWCGDMLDEFDPEWVTSLLNDGSD